jgi:hypothetical protein
MAHRLPAGRCGPTAEENAATIMIGHAPTMSIDQLSRILQLSHAGAVRLVERNLVESDRQLSTAE